MKVSELIEQLRLLPEDATIGTLDMNESRVYEEVSITGNKSEKSEYGDSVLDIEKARRSNETRICDFYITV